MILKYNGKRKLFTYQNIDFSTGKAEVDDIVGNRLIAESNGTFTLWKTPKPSPVIKATPAVTAKVIKRKPKPKPKLKAKPRIK